MRLNGLLRLLIQALGSWPKQVFTDDDVYGQSISLHTNERLTLRIGLQKSTLDRSRFIACRVRGFSSRKCRPVLQEQFLRTLSSRKPTLCFRQ